MINFLAYYGDLLIERYSFDELESLADRDIRLLWQNISTGLRLLKIENFNATELKKLHGMKLGNIEKLANLCTVVRDRNCNDPYNIHSAANKQIINQTSGAAKRRKTSHNWVETIEPELTTDHNDRDAKVGSTDKCSNSRSGINSIKASKTAPDFPKFRPNDQVLNRGKSWFTKRRCNWHQCRNRTKKPCANSECDKVACEKLHSHSVCIECAKTQCDRLTITQKPGYVNKLICKVAIDCKTTTTIACTLCRLPVCDAHRYRLCSDCCFNTEFNFQV